MADVNANIDRTVDNFNGGEHSRSDLAPAIVFLVVVSPFLAILRYMADVVS